MGCLKSPCTTSYKSSIETIALNLTDRQTNRQTNRWTDPMHEAALAIDFVSDFVY